MVHLLKNEWKLVFIDTAALIALGNNRDTQHLEANQIRQQLVTHQSRFLTTNLVIAEFGNSFSAIRLRATAISIIDSIYQSPRWECVHIDPFLMNQGLELFKQMKDKEWGLVDCTSMVVAKHFGVKVIFTTDHHFTQAGFQVLLNPR